MPVSKRNGHLVTALLAREHTSEDCIMIKNIC